MKYGRTGAVAWLGALYYAMQIYFDFSGYSDMAIGIGRMLGFKYPENFEQPYRATSVTQFWRLWHMTLSRWFRDYLYFPLGGNRNGAARTLFNLVLVFVLVGLWHGAAVTFIVWGVYHGFFLVLERVLKKTFGFEFKGIFGTALTFIVVLIGWIFFRAESLPLALDYIAALTDFGSLQDLGRVFIYLTPEKSVVLAIALFFAFVPFGSLNPAHDKEMEFLPPTLRIAAKGTITWLLVILGSANIAKFGFNPFIYFQF